MTTTLEEPTRPEITGRSSSHFTRVTRIFAAELGVEYSLSVVRDLMSADPLDYAGNPALKLPALRTSRGVWFGALPICRELHRQSGSRARIVWPEDLREPLAANAQELAVQAMSTEVALVMSSVGGGGDSSAHQVKMRKSLTSTMSWLDDNAEQALASLPPDRDLSYLETTLFCLVTHLEFRKVLPIDSYAALNAFCQRFSARASARDTAYRFDA